MRILVTGAAGTIGGYLRARLPRAGRVLRLLDIAPIEPSDGEESVVASITDVDAIGNAMRGVDAVVHLAGLSGESTWDRVRVANIDGTLNVIEAARQAGVGRFVFASSAHAVGFLDREVHGGTAPDWAFPAPDTYYGVSKVAGEALGSLYHHRYGMDVVCLRIGHCVERPVGVHGLGSWLSPDDAGRLFDAALTVPAPGFRVVWGVSANTRGWFSTTEGSAIGYVPQDNSEPYADEILAQAGEPDPGDRGQRLVGGPFLTSSFFDVDKLPEPGPGPAELEAAMALEYPRSRRR